MATRAEERERLRLHRLEREGLEEQRQKRVVRLASLAALLAVAVVATLIAISQSRGTGGDATVEGTAEVGAQLAGIPQHGAFLGDPAAPVTVVEFGDLQCPICREYSMGAVADLIEGPVRQGRARLEFRNWTIVGPQSAAAAAAALAAGLQDRQWSFTELFYRNQGIENSGYVSDEFLRSVARGAGVPNLARWERDRASPRWERMLERTSNQAGALGFTGTPSFLVEGPHGSRPLGTPHSAADIEAAISGAG
jgi:protein-disulfide isomerase